MGCGLASMTRAIVKAQLASGWDVICLTGPRHKAPGPDPETVDGITFYRTRAPAAGPSPLREWREIGAAPKPANSDGFGSMLMRSSAQQLRGTVERRFEPDGAVIEITFPLG